MRFCQKKLINDLIELLLDYKLRRKTNQRYLGESIGVDVATPKDRSILEMLALISILLLFVLAVLLMQSSN